uniref:Uncharacterized protein n=1 Tax=Panagrolaimus davidi TaxID=227884 RepID=A0A914PPT3_9BILA
MNRTFSIGPLSFNSFFVEEVGDENTFLSAQAKQGGCAIAQLNAASGMIEVLQSPANNKYLWRCVSLTFGASLGADKNICNETSNDSNSGQYIKSPWGFHYEYDVTKDQIEIVRCCKGNFCNHFGMFDSESAYAWPKKFQYKMNEDWTMRCGYVPVDIFWNIFAPKNQSQECMRAISEEKTSEIQSSLGGRDFVIHPLYIAYKKDDANFTGILPNNVEPTFCFYSGISSSNAMNRSNIFYVPRMVFGCQINQAFTLPFNPIPNFNTEINLYQQNVLRELKKQYDPYSQCITTNGQSLELLAFLRTTNEEKLVWFPVCFAMIYRDFHQTFYRSGPCTADESCCSSGKWIKKYFDLSKHAYNEETKRYEGKPFIKTIKHHKYKCSSQRCLSEKTHARCIYWVHPISFDVPYIVRLLNKHVHSRIYSSYMEQAPVSLTVKEITGYDETSFKEIDRNQEVCFLFLLGCHL